MLVQTGLKPEELIAQVTSKKGTTLAGLSALDRNGFAAAVRAAMRAAVKRSAEIGKELTAKGV
jgi:pyrroline-5-carboxylate reductase